MFVMKRGRRLKVRYPSFLKLEPKSCLMFVWCYSRDAGGYSYTQKWSHYRWKKYPQLE